MLLGEVPDEFCVGPDGKDLRGVAHDARVLGQPLPELVRLEGEAGGLEAEESLLEPGPFRLDDAPGEEALERRCAALALFGPRANGFK